MYSSVKSVWPVVIKAAACKLETMIFRYGTHTWLLYLFNDIIFELLLIIKINYFTFFAVLTCPLISHLSAPTPLSQQTVMSRGCPWLYSKVHVQLTSDISPLMNKIVRCCLLHGRMTVSNWIWCWQQAKVIYLTIYLTRSGIYKVFTYREM